MVFDILNFIVVYIFLFLLNFIPQSSYHPTGGIIGIFRWPISREALYVSFPLFRVHAPVPFGAASDCPIAQLSNRSASDCAISWTRSRAEEHHRGCL